MKNLFETACAMYEEVGKENFLFFIFDPADPDSTSRVNLLLKLKIMGLKGYAENFIITPDNAVTVIKTIESILVSTKKLIVGYNLKNFYTFVKRMTGREFTVQNIFDLYWYESYMRLESSNNNIKTAFKNVLDLSQNKELLEIYKSVIIPLVAKVLPHMESFSLRHEEKCVRVYSNYILEGQENGRLSCTADKKYSFNPHTLGEEKSNLKFMSEYKYFVQFDYRNMEVSVLAQLAQDEILKNIINESKDVYSSIFEHVTGVKNCENAREIGKKLFLPLIYGQTSSSLAKILDISYEQAEEYYKKAKTIFRKSFDFVEAFVDQAKAKGVCLDNFGRVRYFENPEAYKARNFCVQSPSALICLYYLVKLYMASENLYSLVFHVHDGYFIATKKDKIQEAYQVAKKTLEDNCVLMPELKLLTSAKVGVSLDKMHSITNRERLKT